MANDAFALSPISARAALPSADDYQAISDAFMETSRGRWFLTEYARRNRNADTTMVLEAVARIEATIASQKQEPVAAGPTLAETAETLRTLVAHASAAAAAAVERFGDGHDMAPTQRGLRIIREVAWRLREVGYDGRICDILEAQAEHIDANSGPRPTQDLRAAVVAAFETLGRQIAELVETGGTFPAEAATEATAPQAAAADPTAEGPQPVAAHPEIPQPETSREAQQPEAPLSALPQSQPPYDEAPPEASSPPEAAEPDLAAATAEVAVDETVLEVAPTPSVEATGPLSRSEAAVDLSDVALDAAPPAELRAGPEPAPAVLPDQDDAVIEAAVAAPATEVAAGPAPVFAAAPAPEPVIEPPPETIDASTLTAAAIAAAPQGESAPPRISPIPPNTLSLGESLLARGMVASPAGKADPLAPIRRMSQAEKVAFFS